MIESNSDSAEVTVVVDNSASAQNVVRFLESQRFSASLQLSGDDFEIKAERSGGPGTKIPEAETAKPTEKTLVLISKNTMGFGDDVLGSGLILNFLSTLNEMGETLWRLVFLNSGVKLTIARAETLPAPQQLEAQGVSILMYGLVSITSSYWSKSGLERPPICSTL